MVCGLGKGASLNDAYRRTPDPSPVEGGLLSARRRPDIGHYGFRCLSQQRCHGSMRRRATPQLTPYSGERASSPPRAGGGETPSALRPLTSTLSPRGGGTHGGAYAEKLTRLRPARKSPPPHSHTLTNLSRARAPARAPSASK